MADAQQPRVEGPVDDEPESVRRISNRARGLLASVPVLIGLGFVFGYPALIAVAVAPLLLVALALFMVGRRPGGNLHRSVEPSQLTRGEAARALITSVNSRVTPTGEVEAVDSIGGRPVELIIPPVPPRREVTVDYRFIPLRRGELHLGPVTLERRDPWGLFVRRASASAELTVLVHPRVLPVDITLAGNRIGQEGGTADRDVLGSNQFHTLRDYVVGDELRQIHWRSSARVGKLMVKQLVDNPLPRALVVLDTEIRSYGREEDFEQAVDAAASIGSAIVQAGLPVSLRTTGDDGGVEILRVEDLTRLLDALALSNPRQLSVSPRPLRQLLLATKSTSFFLVTGPRSGLVPSAIAALGLVGEGTIVRMGQSGGNSRPRRGLLFRDVTSCEDLAPVTARAAR
jgi:uncharacterized protein (DUF58 family)